MTEFTKQRMWDDRYMELARLVSSWSEDRRTGVGAVLIGPARDILAFGYNGFPRGVDGIADVRHERPTKYLWTEHAERNAVFSAARRGVAINGATMYVTWFPCAACARAMVQSGVSRLVAGMKPDLSDPVWGVEFEVSRQLLDEGSVLVTIWEV